MTKPLTTEQGYAALEEFGFKLVDLDVVGAPTPGRVADRLSDILARLQGARPTDRHRGVAELHRLRLALDAWGIGMTRKGAVPE